MPGKDDKYLTISTSMSGFAALGVLLFGLFGVFLCNWTVFFFGMGGGVSVVVPQAQHTSVLPAQDTGVRVSVQADGKVWVENRWVPPELVNKALRGQHRVNSVFLRVDRRVPFSKVRPILRSIRSAGIRNVYLVTPWPEIGLYRYLFRHPHPSPNL